MSTEGTVPEAANLPPYPCPALLCQSPCFQLMKTSSIDTNTKCRSLQTDSMSTPSQQLSDIQLPWDSFQSGSVAETDALRAVRDLLNQDIRKLARYFVRPARGLLLSGPPGVGKTHSVGQAAREHGMDVWMIVPGPQAAGRLRDAVKRHARQECVIFIDEMDEVIGKDLGMVGLVKELLDDLTYKAYIIGATNRASTVHPALLRAGRMDRHVELGALNDAQRFDILKVLCTTQPSVNDSILSKVATMTPGYVVGDLRSLVSRTSEALASIDHEDDDDVLNLWREEIRAGPTPAILRTSLTVSASGDQGWDMISGNEKAKEELQRAIEWPLKHQDTYKRLNLMRPRGVLLHGPPGCAKTTLVRAAAQRASIPLLRLTAADVYSSYVGDSERIVRDAFTKARAAAPALLFLDEIDALAMRREKQQQDAEGNQVQQRVLTTLLTEMDGLSTSSLSGQQDDGVIVVAATNRVDVIDDAILRPGRFDVVIHIDLPDFDERCKLLRLFTHSLTISECVDLEFIASRTDGNSGAHLKGLCEQAAVAALREHIAVMIDSRGDECGTIGNENQDENEIEVTVRMRHFETGL